MARGDKILLSYVDPEMPVAREGLALREECARPLPCYRFTRRAMEVSMLITRRHAFGLGGAAIGCAGLALAGAQRTAAAAPQVTQDAAGYQNQPKGDQRCALCAHFQAPASCELVQGTIVPNGWCKLYRAKSS